MSESVTLKGQSFSLKGTLPKEGSKLPDCELVDLDLKPVKLSSFKGKILLLISVPSLDTPVCSQEARRFNQEISTFAPHVNPVFVSMDLPFAQKRWCAAEGIKNLIILSDFNKREFASKFGVGIEGLGLLARAVFIYDQNLTLQNVHLVKEVTEEPDYHQIFEEIRQLLAHVKK